MIINDWLPTLAKIYKDEIALLNRNQSKCQQFFDSAAVFLSLQVRQLIEKSIQAYVEFIRQFDQKVLNPPDTVVYLEKTYNTYEKCFLNVRISHRRDEIYFMDNMAEVEQKLQLVLDNIRKFSENIPRPENLITKTDKMFIPHIEASD